MPWSAPFDDPIILPDGRKLVTLKDAATYITGLPKKESVVRLRTLPTSGVQHYLGRRLGVKSSADHSHSVIPDDLFG